MNIRFCWLSFLIWIPLTGQARVLPAANFPSSAAAAGMGGVSLLPGPDAPAVFSSGDAWPAAAVLGEVRAAAAVHGLAWNGTSDGDVLLGAGGFVRVGRWGVHAAASAYLQQELTEYNDQGMPLGTFRPQDRSCSLGASYGLTARWAVSVTARYTTTELASTASDEVPGADAAVVYAVPHFRAGLSVRHLGPKVNYGGGDYSQPAQLVGGAGVSRGAWAAAAEGVCVFDAGHLVRLGLQHAFGKSLRLRAGCQLSDEPELQPAYATTGLGLRAGPLWIDAAYLFASPQLEPSLQVGLAWACGR